MLQTLRDRFALVLLDEDALDRSHVLFDALHLLAKFSTLDLTDDRLNFYGVHPFGEVSVGRELTSPSNQDTEGGQYGHANLGYLRDRRPC